MNVTDGDRERARKYWLDARYGEMEEMEDVIAQVIAEEREKARAPFLALADEMEHHDARLCSAMAARKRLEFDLASEAAYAMQAADLRMDARRIRRVAEVDE